MDDEAPITKERKREIFDKPVENGGVEEIKKFNAKDVLKTDGISLAILFLLYVLQGIPLGLAGSIPMLLQQKGKTYQEQAKFSFVFWPFSLKLLWAPIVDGAFSATFGRRKSWLIPVQFALAAVMYYLSLHVDELLDGDIFTLTASFFALNFFAATQDIAVDGWALTMLTKPNRNLASTMNSIGQTAGYFLGYVVFLALESAEFCNSYMPFRTEPQETGVVTLPEFMAFWAVVFVVTTTILIFKHEEKDDEEVEGVVETYKQLYTVLKLDCVKQWVVIVLTCKMAFAAVDSVAGLKLLDQGVPKEKMAMLAIPLTPVQIILPAILAPYTTGDEPLKLWFKSYVPRLVVGGIFTVWVYFTPAMLQGESPGMGYFSVMMVIYMCHQLFIYAMFVSIMSFHARVSDPSIGGTYMTLLNTVCNLGGNWPATLALWAVDPLSKMGLGDGFYLESFICFVLGLAWVHFIFPRLKHLQTLPTSAWAVPKADRKTD